MRRFARERRGAEEHLEDHDAVAIEIGAIVDLFAGRKIAELLGRHVFRIADQHSDLRLFRRRSCIRVLGDAEVDDLRDQKTFGVVRQHHVIGRDVAMEQTASMNVIESIENLHRDVGRERERETAVRFAPLAHGRTVDELGDHVASALGEKKIVDDGDVAVMNLRRHLRFAEKPRAVRVIDEQSLLHHFDAAEGVEVDVTRFEDFAHPTGSEEGEDFVFAVEQRSGSDLDHL